MAVKTKITIVGCGPGGADYLTPAACREVEKADVLVGARRLQKLFHGSKAKRVFVGADLDSALNDMENYKDKRIAVLVSGDPGLCSFAKPVIRRFGRKVCKVIAGISSIQAAFAGVGVDWFDVRVIHAHSGVPKIRPETLVEEKRIAILAGHRGAAGWLRSLAGALGRKYMIFVCENLTMANERIRKIKPAALKTLKFEGQQVILMIHEEIL